MNETFSGAFDEQLYLSLNPDIAELVAQGKIASGFSHWIAEGREEEAAGYRPTIRKDCYYASGMGNPHAMPSRAEMALFDPVYYLNSNEDVRKSTMGSHTGALEHWLRYGRAEGRRGWRSDADLRRKVGLDELASRPFGVNFFAPFSARSGLGTAARGYLAALRVLGLPVHLVNVDFSKGALRITQRDYETRPPYRINLIQVNADSIGSFSKLFQEGWLNSYYNIASWAWELNVVRPDWYSAFSIIDEVWTPSASNSQAVAAISPVPVRTLPYVVAPSPRGRFDRAHFELPPGFLFLAAFDVGSSLDRKNPQAAIDAFKAAFPKPDGVYLVLKFHSSHHNPRQVRALLQAAGNAPNVIVMTNNMSDEEWRSLQACMDCLVSPHRSEGFGLNVAEAMSLGKPVIATAYSGNLEFTTRENSYLIPYKLRPLERPSGPYLPNYLWAEPDVRALAEIMRQVVDQPEQRQRIGEAAMLTITSRFSAAAIGAKMSRRFDELGLRQELPPYAAALGRSASITSPEYAIIEPIPDPVRAESRPVLSVIVPVFDVAAEHLFSCIESVRRQTYPHWELCLCNDASSRRETLAALQRYQGIDPRIRIKHLARNQGIAGASNEAALLATGSYLVMLDNDDELTPDALEKIADVVRSNPKIDALYSDEDKLDAQGQLGEHYFKPDWSPEHLESVMYTLHPLTIRASLFHELGGFRPQYSGAQDWDLMLRVSRETDAIFHIPQILYHWRQIPGSAAAAVNAKPKALTKGAEALRDHVRVKYGATARVEPGEIPGYYRVHHQIRGNPPVTLLITTNNGQIALPGRKKFTMADNLISSIREHTDYENYKIVLVDNNNSSLKQRREREKLGVDCRSYPGSVAPFNFADKANFALRQADTEHVVLMNDDMEAFHPDWLSALLEFSQQRGIGAVGGKLLHADGTIQHVGSVLGIGNGSAHVYHGFPGDFVGYNGYTHVIRNYSALTGACLATRRTVLNELGGFDTGLAIDYNDIDLCLRMGKQGYRLVYTPYSKMYHFESKTAVRETQNPDEVALFRYRWSELINDDPYYNPNLSRDKHDFSMRRA